MNNRRFFLKNALAASLALPALARASLPGGSTPPVEHSLRFYNTHTGETLRSVFWAEGQFVPDALLDINKLLRDHRSNTIAAIDPQLLLLLGKVSMEFGNNSIVHVISGYRSPQTNRKLAETNVRKAALALGGGGVGYYPNSQFVHMDTGRVRNW